MSKVKGYLVGFAMSLLGVALWVFLGAVVGIVAGIAGALSGILFIVGYKMFNKEKIGIIPFIVGGALILIEVFVAELIVVAIVAETLEVSMSVALNDSEFMGLVVRDILFGVIFGLGAFIGYGFSLNKKSKGMESREVNTENLTAEKVVSQNETEE